MTEYDRRLFPVQLLIATYLTIAFLQLSSAVTMPLAASLFIVGLAWPFHQWVGRRLAYPFNVIATLIAILAVCSLLMLGVLLCVHAISTDAMRYEAKLSALVRDASGWLERMNIDLNLQDMIGRGAEFAGSILGALYDSIGAMFLIAAFTILALLEVEGTRFKLHRHRHSPLAQKISCAFQQTAANLPPFMLTRTVTSAVTGILTSLYTWLLGLDLVFVWGFIAFVLNYVPFIGSMIAVIPPTLLALVLPEPLWRAPAVFFGLSTIQFVIGNYVDPRLQGRYLPVSPLFVLFSIIFWGWVWRIPGAVLGVPLTVTFAIFCRQFDETRWLAEALVSGETGPSEREEGGDVPQEGRSAVADAPPAG